MLESIWVQLSITDNSKFLIGGCYRPEEDEVSIVQKLAKSINRVSTSSCLLVEDFNFRKINWPGPHGTNEVEEICLKTIQDNLLHQVISESTRGEKTLSLAFFSDLYLISEIKVDKLFATSDHNTVFVSLSLPINRINKDIRKIYLYIKGDFINMDQSMKDTDREKLFHN